MLDAGRTLIGSSPHAIRIAASKRETHRILSANAVASVPTFRIHEARQRHDGPWVAKPDDGCGCEDTRLFPHEAAAVRWIASRTDATRFVLQPHVPGEALSLSVLARGGTAWLLCVNRQRMQVRNDAFEFTGAEVNAIVDRDDVFANLVRSVVGALPGLHGYCGIDLVLTPSGPVVVDVNPRLTTSWVGLGAALRCNPAALVLDLMKADRFALPAFARSAVEVRVGA
ncbi:MAG: ATP-grasp domain-containing protein [Casimicrobiaceae bacterium]